MTASHHSDKQAYASYGRQQILSAHPALLVAMLFERAIRALHDTEQAIIAGHIEKRWQATKKVFDIIEHLMITLDHERGGEIAINLERIYGYIQRCLYTINKDNSAEQARDAISLLEPLAVSWRQIAEQRPTTTTENTAASQPVAQPATQPATQSPTQSPTQLAARSPAQPSAPQVQPTHASQASGALSSAPDARPQASSFNLST